MGCCFHVKLFEVSFKESDDAFLYNWLWHHIGDELNRPDYEDGHDRQGRRQRPIEDRPEKPAQADVEEESKAENVKSTSEPKA